MVASLVPHGFAPSEGWKLTLYEYRVIVSALNEANATEEDQAGGPLSDDRTEDMARQLRAAKEQFAREQADAKQ